MRDAISTDKGVKMNEVKTYTKRYMDTSRVLADLDCIHVDGRVYTSTEDLQGCLGRLCLEVQQEVEKTVALVKVAVPESDRCGELCDKATELIGFSDALLMVVGLMEQVTVSMPVDKKR